MNSETNIRIWGLGGVEGGGGREVVESVYRQTFQYIS